MEEESSTTIKDNKEIIDVNVLTENIKQEKIIYYLEK